MTIQDPDVAVPVDTNATPVPELRTNGCGRPATVVIVGNPARDDSGGSAPHFDPANSVRPYSC
jgi:hypothetical protein